MKTHEVTSAIIIKHSRKAKNGKIPLMLRITYQKKQHFINLRDTSGATIKVTLSEYKKLNSSTGNDENIIQLKLYIAEIQKEAAKVAAKIINEYEYFSFDSFKERFFSKEPEQDPKDLFISLEQRARELKSEGRISSASCLMCAMKSLQVFTKTRELHFDKCTPTFFEKYEKWFINKGGTNTTVGIYLRNVRTVFNLKIKERVLSPDHYPFKHYKIPTGANIKKALTFEKLKQVVSFRFTGADEYRNYYKDLWTFSYLCNGMNIKDIANLQYSDIDEDFITFKRQKTIRAKKSKIIEVHIHQETGRILDSYGTKTGKYIFSIFREGMTPEQQYRAVQQMVQNINKTMAIVSDILGLPKIKVMTARHTFATVLKRSGASVEYIQESLGHQDKGTTEAYLSNFERDTKRANSNKLL
jgi:integrase/recombinase XerD